MKVWTVSLCYDHEGESVESIHSTEGGAINAVARLKAVPGLVDGSYCYDAVYMEWEVDG